MRAAAPVSSCPYCRSPVLRVHPSGRTASCRTCGRVLFADAFYVPDVSSGVVTSLHGRDGLAEGQLVAVQWSPVTDRRLCERVVTARAVS